MSDRIVFQITMNDDGEVTVTRNGTSIEIYGLLQLECLIQEQFLLKATSGYSIPVPKDPVDELIIPLDDDGKRSH